MDETWLDVYLDECEAELEDGTLSVPEYDEYGHLKTSQESGGTQWN